MVESQLPDLGVLTQLFETLFYLSIQTEEGHQVACSCAFMHPAWSAKKSRPRPLDVAISAPEYTRFPHGLPYDTRTLRKLAQAVDPSYAALAVCEKNHELSVWGIVDQQPLQLQRFTNWESTSRAFSPGLFYACITAPGEITVYIGDRVVAVLRQDKVISRELDALWSGPLSVALNPHVRRFQTAVRKTAGDVLYKSAGRWFEGTDELWRCSEDFGPELRDMWLGAVCRVLLRIRNYRHGGAVIICPKGRTRDLNIKYPLDYSRISDSLRAYAAAHISQQFIETEARQGRLKPLMFVSKPVAGFGYFVTPDGRENIFMQEVPLLDNEALFRSWHQIALRSDALAALAGSVGIVASLSRVDGAVLLQNGLDVAGFGIEIRTKADVEIVHLAGDEQATKLTAADPRSFGTRHRSMMRYCQAHPSAVGIVISQDGDIRAITTVDSKLVMWEQLQLKAGTPNDELYPLQMEGRLGKDAPRK